MGLTDVVSIREVLMRDVLKFELGRPGCRKYCVTDRGGGAAPSSISPSLAVESGLHLPDIRTAICFTCIAEQANTLLLKAQYKMLSQ